MKKIVAIVGASLLVLLTGCSQVNSAATIGTTDIPISTVQTTVKNVLADRSQVDTSTMHLQTGAELNVSVLRFHVISILFDQLATAMKLTVSDAEIATNRASIVAKVGGEAVLPKALVNAGIAKSDFVRYLRTIQIAQKLGKVAAAAGDSTTDGSAIQKLIVAQAKKDKVVINPKYGSWDAATANIVAAPANTASAK